MTYSYVSFNLIINKLLCLSVRNIKYLILLNSLLFVLFNGNSQVQKGLDIDGSINSELGRSLSMPDQNTIAVGAPEYFDSFGIFGKAQVFEWNGSSWQQKGSDLIGENDGDKFGWSISMPDANTVAVGAPHNDGNGSNSGHVRVFRWNGSNWVQKGLDIDGELNEDQSGWQVSMPDANTVAISATYNDGSIAFSNSGQIRVFEWDGSSWIQKGIDLDGEATGDFFGWSLTMPNSNIVAAGSITNSGNGSTAGHARIYEWNGSAWVQKGADIDGDNSGDGSGRSISMPNQNTIAIGANSNDDFLTNAGQVRIFEWNGSNWVQKGTDIFGEEVGDAAGVMVSMPDENTIAISSKDHDGNAANDGKVRIFEWNGTSWSQLGNDIIGEAESDQFGTSLSMPNTQCIGIGTPLNDQNGSNSGHARVYSLCQATSGIDLQTACSSYTWIDGNTYTSSNNTATWTLTNAAGCDSIVTLDLTIEDITAPVADMASLVDLTDECEITSLTAPTATDNCAGTITGTHGATLPITSTTTITWTYDDGNGNTSAQTQEVIITPIDNSVSFVNDITLSADASGYSYQWVDCDDNNSPIAGETNQTFEAQSNGGFAVIIDNGDCSVISGCFDITTVGLVNNKIQTMNVFPNPTSGTVTIHSTFPFSAVEIVNAMGQVVYSKHSNMVVTKQISLPDANGVYMVKIFGESSVEIFRVIKQ